MTRPTLMPLWVVMHGKNWVLVFWEDINVNWEEIANNWNG